MTMAKLLVAGGAFDQESCGDTFWPSQFGLLARLPAYLRATMALSFQEDEVTVKGLGFTSAAWPAAANSAAPRSAAIRMRMLMERSSPLMLSRPALLTWLSHARRMHPPVQFTRLRAAESKGQRGRGAKSSPSVSPALKRSIPAQAIIAALSVQSAGGGSTSTQPVFAARPASPWRRRALAATPPDATRWRAPGCFARKTSSAWAVRSSRQWFMACWSEAARSARAPWSRLPSESSFATVPDSAVFNPEKEKSQPARPSIGRGRGKRDADPVSAAAAIA